jgi:hypothetical protein
LSLTDLLFRQPGLWGGNTILVWQVYSADAGVIDVERSQEAFFEECFQRVLG